MQMNNENCTAEKVSRALKATSKTHVRRIALNYAAAHRSHRFTRVSDDFLTAIEIAALKFITDRIDRHPSRGQTLC
jgi:hypothetical protein